jgi:iron complex transport system substrate-binding protein
MRPKAPFVLWLIVLLASAACAPPARPLPTAPLPPTAVPTPQPPAQPAAAAQPTGGYSVTDAMGRSIAFSRPPQKIVLAGKALIMVADAIYLFPEAGARIAALGSTSQGSGNFIPMIDANFSSKISLKGDAGPEQIAAAQPDCVIMKSSNAEKLGKPLEAIQIPVVYVDFETPDQYQRDLKTLGVLFQNNDRAQAVAAFYQSRVDAITKATSALTDNQKPRTLVLYYNDQGGTVAFDLPPMSWMQTLIVQTAGGRPVWKDANLSNSWTKVTLEQIAAWDADTIFVIAYFTPVSDVVKKLKVDPQWQALRAVKNNQLYAFAGDVYSWDQPDPRWILGLTWVAGKLHPDLFPGLDIKKEARTFYQELYGLDDAAFQTNILPKLTAGVP